MAHEDTYILGLCTGLFAAAAVASTGSVSTLIPLAVQTVLMAFRIGSHVASLAERLCPATDRSDPWTHVLVDVTEADVNKALQSFHSSHVSTPTYSAMVSTAVNIVLPSPYLLLARPTLVLCLPTV